MKWLWEQEPGECYGAQLDAWTLGSQLLIYMASRPTSSLWTQVLDEGSLSRGP